jgi:hypothetical protein
MRLWYLSSIEPPVAQRNDDANNLFGLIRSALAV